MSTFTAYLKALVESIEGAEGAVFADIEGETVAHYGSDATVLQALAGHLALTVRDLQPRQLDDLLVRTSRATLIVVPVQPDYFVALALTKETLTVAATFALRHTIDCLRAEM